MSKRNRKRLLDYTMRGKKSFYLGLFFTLIAVVTELAGPYLIGRILDGELMGPGGVSNTALFVRLLTLFGVSIALAAVFRYFSAYYLRKKADEVALAMQRDVFAHVQKLPIAFFDNLPAGKIVSRITNDTKDIRLLYQVVLSQILTVTVFALGVYIALLTISKELFFMALVPLPILWLILRDYQKKSFYHNTIYRKNISQLNADINEVIQGVEVIQAFNREEDTMEDFHKVSNEIYRHGMGLVVLESYSSFNASNTLQLLVLAGALFYFGYGNITGAYAVRIGMIYIFIDYMTKFFGQAINAIQRVGQLERAKTAVEHIFTILDEEEEQEIETISIPENDHVFFENVTFSYKDDDLVLKNVTFDVKEGETAAFVGHTGSGKTTIMNLLLRFYEPNSGAIRLGGVDYHSLSKKHTRENMAVVLQDPTIFSATLYENITLYDPQISPEDVEKALMAIGGEKLLDLPEGLETKITEKGSSLSAGERQLLSFARAFVRNPRILVLDEATSNMDSATEEIIQKAIKNLGQGRTTFIIAHRLSTIHHADKIFVLEKGEIVEKGNHEELLEQKGIYARMYEDQQLQKKEA